jgi:PEP-CTERM motif
MVSVIAHELIEATTDPLGTAWWDSNPSSRTYGYENADMCAWKFGTTYTTNNGAQANIKVGKKNFLLQQQWVNTGGGNGSCAMSYAGPPISGAPALVLADSGGAGLPVRAVPEPASLAVFSAGLIGLAGVRRRRRERLA